MFLVLNQSLTFWLKKCKNVRRMSPLWRADYPTSVYWGVLFPSSEASAVQHCQRRDTRPDTGTAPVSKSSLSFI